MGQYVDGTITFTNGSANVVGVGTLFLSNVSVGDWISLQGQGNLIYFVLSVTDDTNLVLTTTYAGATASGQAYWTFNYFTSPDNLPILSENDVDTHRIMSRLSIELQTIISGLKSNEVSNFTDEVNQIFTGVAVVDALIYDTTQDSDLGNWRFLKKSWYSESVPSGIFVGRFADEAAARAGGGLENDWYARTGTTDFYKLNASTETQIYRAGRKEFPKISLIIAETDRVIIYDLTSIEPSMWMVSNVSNVTAIDALEGLVVINSSTVGIVEQLFPRDLNKLDIRLNGYEQYIKSILQRNDATSSTGEVTKGIINLTLNDIAMTVLPDAPIDSVTGLKVPTIAVATDGGVSVITDIGDVFDIIDTVYADYNHVAFSKSGGLKATNRTITGDFPYLEIYNSLPIADISNSSDFQIDTSSIPTYSRDTGYIKKYIDNVIGSDLGITLLKENFDSFTASMVAYITKDHATGWMVGDIRGCFLSDSNVGSLVGGTVEDRSVKNNSIAVIGTITKDLIGTNSELVKFYGFSASNYLEQAYNTDLDFGTDNFYFGMWLNESANTAIEVLFYRGASVQTITGYVNADGTLSFSIDDGTAGSDTTSSSSAIDDGQDHFVEMFRDGNSIYIYVDGVQWGEQTIVNATTSLSNASAALRIGESFAGAQPLTNGSIALFRVSATVPTAEQRKHIYETERQMILNKCLLDGDSNAITALNFNEKRNLLSAGSSWGRTDFNNLVRVDSEATNVGSLTAIAYDGDLILNGGASGSDILIPEIDLRAKLIGVDLKAVDDDSWVNMELLNNWVAFGATTSQPQYRKVNGHVELKGLVKTGTIGTIIFTLPIGYRPSLNTNFGTASNDAYGQFSIDTDGDIQADVGSNVWFSLDGVSFPVS